MVSAVSILVLVTSAGGWIYLKLHGAIAAFGADGISDSRPAASSKGQNVLVIGSDGRTGGNSGFGGGDENDIGRSDTAFLVHISANHRHAVALSIPRDTLVDIPPCKLPDGSWTRTQTGAMFNAAFSVGQTLKGNPACTQNTVEKLTGLRVDHTIVADFKGFANLTEAVGGVPVCLPRDIYQKDLDPHRTTRGTLLFAKGEQTVSGQRALDYVRLRHGIGDGSDLGRIKRQQAFAASLIKKVRSQGFTPAGLLPLADAVTKSMTVDPGLASADKLLTFAMSMKDIDLHHTEFITVPWRYDGNRVAVVEPDAHALFSALKADRMTDGKDASGRTGGKPTAAFASPTADDGVSGEGIRVAVHNGTTAVGLAARTAKVFADHHFTVTSTGNADGQDHIATLIEYGPGQQSQAQTVARLIPGAALKAAPTPGINVILGRSYADESTTGATTMPSATAHDARSADDGLCSNLSYG
nr:LCP family protein [Streptomyces sp. NBRC 110611]